MTVVPAPGAAVPGPHRPLAFFRQDVEVPAGTAAQLLALGVDLVEGTVTRVAGEVGGIGVEGPDRGVVEVEALVVAPWFRARGDLVRAGVRALVGAGPARGESGPRRPVG